MDNITEKKSQQDILLDLQMDAAKKSRIPDMLTVITGAFIMLAIAVAMFIIPDKTFSEQENRELQQFPALSSKDKFLDRLIDGSFTKEMAKYYSDQFPFRDTFVGLKGFAEIALLKNENDGVILAKNDYLITKDYSASNLDDAVANLIDNIDGIGEFANVLAEMKVPVMLAAAGRSVDVLSEKLPSSYPKATSEKLWEVFGRADYYRTDAKKNLTGVNLCAALKTKLSVGQLYYRTDHHWTTLGAYYAYKEIIESFRDENIVPLPLSDFKRETVSDSFYGTTWSKAGMKWIKPDSIEYFRYNGDEDFVMTIKDTGAVFNGFYDVSYLDKKDKYGSFLSGNNARVDITKTETSETRPKMLVIKDSFAHSVIPFLAEHYDLVILDYRYSPLYSAAKIVFEENIDRVLFLHNMENLSESNIYGSTVDEDDDNKIIPGVLQYGVESSLQNYRDYNRSVKNIFINGNPIAEYTIIVPTAEKDGNKYYFNAAEKLQKAIFNRSGIEVKIEKRDDWSELDKIITFTSEGLPGIGFIKISVEGNNLVFRCNIGVDSPGYAADCFTFKYLGRRASGSFNFGENFIYSDIGTNAVIMLKPGQ